MNPVSALRRVSSTPAVLLRYAFLLLTLLATAPALAEGVPVGYYYLGELAGSPTQLHLQLDAPRAAGAQLAASGWLLDETTGATTEFSGVFRPSDDSLFLDLSAAGQLFGHLPASPAADGLTFSGNLLLASSAESFEFKRVAQFVTTKLQQGRIATTSMYPYFTAQRMQNINDFLQPDLLAEQICFFSAGQNQEVAGELSSAWTYASDTTVAFAVPGFFSGLTTVSSYTGGAHPRLEYWPYNLAYVGTSLREFLLSDLFVSGTDVPALLSPLVAAQLREQGATVPAGTVFAEADLAIFTVSPAGLTIVFPPYTVGSWAEGTWWVSIPFTQLDTAPNTVDPVLDHAGPLRHLAHLPLPFLQE